MSYSQNELHAVLEGLSRQQLDQQEILAGLAANIRVAMNKKRLKSKDLFNRRKAEARVKHIFNNGESPQQIDRGLAERIKYANEYFMNKRREG